MFGCRKMKCRESSETRFGKVWCRSELCSRGKRPFEVSKNRSNKICFAPIGSQLADRCGGRGGEVNNATGEVNNAARFRVSRTRLILGHILCPTDVCAPFQTVQPFASCCWRSQLSCTACDRTFRSASGVR